VSRLVASVGLFLLAGFCEIGGGYLMWRWWRDAGHWSLGALGAVVLVVYGIVPTFQPVHFGRAYAAYGGVFVVLSLVWSTVIDGTAPDRFDVMGASLCLLGVAVIMYWPR
jgi:small multidrug resistance family-3 protein